MNTFHEKISNSITIFLDNIYYKNLQKIYNDNLNNIFINYKYPIIKPEYFIFLQYYFIYTFLYYLSYKKSIMYTISIHSIYISELIFDNLIKKYEYTPLKNIEYLKINSSFLFIYLFFLKIFLSNISFYNKIFLLTVFHSFYGVYLVNNIYKLRLNSIEMKKDFYHPLKIIIITPNKKIIKKILDYTQFFTYSNYLLIINILLFFFF